MDTLVLGLLFVIGCLSVLICLLIRIVVELINGSNRKHHKSHVSIMWAAFCGDYRNIDGDFRYGVGVEAGGEAGVEHYQQQLDHSQPPQSQYYSQHQTQQTHQPLQSSHSQSQPGHRRHTHHTPASSSSHGPSLHAQRTGTAPPPPPLALADDLRITFSDVRMTEYQLNERDGLAERAGGAGAGAGAGGGEGQGDDTRITFSDVRMTEVGGPLPAGSGHSTLTPVSGSGSGSGRPDTGSNSSSSGGSHAEEDGQHHHAESTRRNSAVCHITPHHTTSQDITSPHLTCHHITLPHMMQHLFLSHLFSVLCLSAGFLQGAQLARHKAEVERRSHQQ